MSEKIQNSLQEKKTELVNLETPQTVFLNDYESWTAEIWHTYSRAVMITTQGYAKFQFSTIYSLREKLFGGFQD